MSIWLANGDRVVDLGELLLQDGLCAKLGGLAQPPNVRLGFNCALELPDGGFSGFDVRDLLQLHDVFACISVWPPRRLAALARALLQRWQKRENLLPALIGRAQLLVAISGP